MICIQKTINVKYLSPLYNLIKFCFLFVLVLSNLSEKFI
jgi:hypothetical protein